jgi:hypothetical protein
MWQREDDVKVRAWEQTFELGLEPLLTGSRGTPRATSVAACVVLNDAAMAVRAGQGVRAQRIAVAIPDALRGTLLARVE